jgi:hydrogenase maturation factor HypE
MSNFIIVVILSIFFYYFIFGKIKELIAVGKELQGIVKQMTENGADDHLTKQLINLLKYKHKRVPNKPAHWDYMRAIFELVNQSSKVDTKLKHELRNVLLGKGVSRMEKVNDNSRMQA